MKKIIVFLLAFTLSLSTVISIHATDGKVTYDGNAREFIFAPGSEQSPTDLFSNFKDVMPGDTLTQRITVKNAADHKVKVKIYIRSLGAHEDSVEFLSQLGLQVAKCSDNEMAYMFDAAADQSAQLTDWVCLGTLYSGGEVNLDVTLCVSVELDNAFQSRIGYLDWEFMIEEFPIEDTDPLPPQTGDTSPVSFGIAGALCSLIVILLLLVGYRKKKDTNNKEN